MKNVLLILLALLALGPSAGAEVVIHKLDHFIPDLRSAVGLPVVEPKLDSPGELFVIPYFEVDTANPTSGNTTLIAIRNTTNGTRSVQIEYRFPNSNLMLSENIDLTAKRVHTANLRDLGLIPQGDGFVRGYVRVLDTGAVLDPTLVPTLTVDYYLVDDANNFAFGERAINLTADDPLNDLCQGFETRFARGGAFDTTELIIFVTNPQGGDPTTDPPTLLVNAYNEAGTAAGFTFSVYTNQNSFKVDVGDLTNFSFGALEIMLNNTEGHITAETRALGKFSGGFNAACTVP